MTDTVFNGISDMLRLIDSHKIRENDLKEIQKIYTEAFPPEERRDWKDVMRLLENESIFWLTAAYMDEELIGFITGWNFPEFIYMEHFATAPSARNKGYGATIFSGVLSASGKPHVIEVERPDNEMASRRIGFYERLGLHISDRDYVQPPYAKGGNPVPMFIMTDKGYEKRWVDEIHKTVYSYTAPAESGTAR